MWKWNSRFIRSHPDRRQTLPKFKLESGLSRRYGDLGAALTARGAESRIAEKTCCGAPQNEPVAGVALRDADEVLHERLMGVDVRRHDGLRLRDRRTD
jgi:hypothetical protein